MIYIMSLNCQNDSQIQLNSDLFIQRHHRCHVMPLQRHNPVQANSLENILEW